MKREGCAGVLARHSTDEAGEPKPEGTRWRKGRGRERGIVGGQDDEDFELGNHLNATPANSKTDLRVRDGVIRRTIHKWLKAGVMESGSVWYPKKGSPQGGVVSPILANIYLHEVLDKWFEEVVRPQLEAEARIVRFADDFVIVFCSLRDARKVLSVLRKRFAKYKLEIHPDKTRLVEFLRPRLRDKRGRNSVDFLGFTHHWGRSRNNKWIVKQKTSKKRLNRAVKNVSSWCRRNLHRKVREQHEHLCKMITGHINYYGVTGNIRSLKSFIQEVRRVWRKWIDRRNRENSMPWKRFVRLLSRYPLPKARIPHSHPCLVKA